MSSTISSSWRTASASCTPASHRRWRHGCRRSRESIESCWSARPRPPLSSSASLTGLPRGEGCFGRTRGRMSVLRSRLSTPSLDTSAREARIYEAGWTRMEASAATSRALPRSLRTLCIRARAPSSSSTNRCLQGNTWCQCGWATATFLAAPSNRSSRPATPTLPRALPQGWGCSARRQAWKQHSRSRRATSSATSDPAAAISTMSASRDRCASTRK
mmetsp:Transcript_42906/g.102065  ORF Transcript_42906/g.102065 Transcript_42906/m.102065 type:complete len:217 (+) Transcript_42906:217-867(+)